MKFDPLSVLMWETLQFISERDSPTTGIPPGTLKALRLRGFIEPVAFEPCCPVPLPSWWRITPEGRIELERIREEVRRVLKKLAELKPRIRPVRRDARTYDTVKLVGGEILHTHLPATCKGQACSVHNPSDHHMAKWRQHWRSDRKIMERLCPHGVGHPDPDEMSFLKKRLPKREFETHGVHGCDGCCRPPKEKS